MQKLVLILFITINILYADDREEFIQAIYKGDLESVKHHINSGLDVNFFTDDPEDEGFLVVTPLSVATKYKKFEIVKLLLANGYFINLNYDAVNKTSLALAARNNDFKIAKYLISKGARVNVRKKTQYSPLMMAVSQGHFEMADYLIKEGAEVSNYLEDKTVNDYLITGIGLDNFKSLRYMVEHGMKLNTKKFNLEEFLSYLETDSFKYLANFVIKSGKIKDLGINIKQFAKWSIKYNDLDLLKRLIKEDKNILNHKIESKKPLIIYSIENNKDDITKYLLKQDIDINILDENANNILTIAINENNSFEIIKSIIDLGVDIHAKDYEADNSPLFRAADNGRLDVFKYLLEKGVNLKHRNTEGLDVSYYILNEDIIKYLIINKQFDVDALQNDKQSRLIDFINYGLTDLAKLMVKNGANLDIQDNDGNTALIYAVQQNYLYLTHYLVTHGANINIKNKENKKAIDYAKDKFIINLLK
jgi:ankyrin repeat protein